MLLGVFCQRLLGVQKDFLLWHVENADKGNNLMHVTEK